jgi:hypothetical protein
MTDYSCRLLYLRTVTGVISVRRKAEVHTGFRYGDQREGDHLGDPGVNGGIILKWIFKN